METLRTNKIDFSQAIDRHALREAMKDKTKRKEIERIIANFSQRIR